MRDIVSCADGMRVALVSFALLLGAGPARAGASDIERVPDFALLDHRGHAHELARADASVVVLFVTGVGCPVARQSIGTLKDLSRRYGQRGVVFWLLDAQPQDDRASIAKEAQEFHVGRLPILHDEAQLVARQLGLHHTGEAIAIATRDRRIFYRGAVDDRASPGAQRAEAKERFLESALDDYLGGRPIARPRVPTVGCAVTVESERPVSYAKEVAPLVIDRCLSCHRSAHDGAPAFDSEGHLRAAAPALRRVLLERRMPPGAADPHAGLALASDRSLSASEERRLWTWLEQPAEGIEGDDPLRRAPAAPAALPAKADVHLAVTASPGGPAAVTFAGPGLWIRGAAIRWAATDDVAQVIVRMRAPGATTDVLFARALPGSAVEVFPAGTGRWIAPGTRFEVELSRRSRRASASIALDLYRAAGEPTPFETRELAATELSIPPREPAARTFAMLRLPRATLLYELAPHMKRRGAWSTFEALYPDGTRETLLSVPAFDWRWQRSYRLAEPKRLPAGTWILQTGGFDNSPRNPFNPAPDRRLAVGEGPDDELFVGTVGIVETPAPKGSR